MYGNLPSVVGYVYINDNTAGMNTIGAFNRLADGVLVPMHGSPFAAGGAGAGTLSPAPLASQGALQLSSDRKYLLAVDAGSNQISVLRIGPDSELSRVLGGPVSSGGIEPVSIAAHGALVYVANDGNGTTGANYKGTAPWQQQSDHTPSTAMKGSSSPSLARPRG